MLIGQQVSTTNSFDASVPEDPSYTGNVIQTSVTLNSNGSPSELSLSTLTELMLMMIGGITAVAVMGCLFVVIFYLWMKSNRDRIDSMPKEGGGDDTTDTVIVMPKIHKIPSIPRPRVPLIPQQIQVPGPGAQPVDHEVVPSESAATDNMEKSVSSANPDDMFLLDSVNATHRMLYQRHHVCLERVFTVI